MSARYWPTDDGQLGVSWPSCTLDAYPWSVVVVFCMFSDSLLVCVLRVCSTSPSSQSSKMNSMLYPKQFQSGSAGMRIAQHFPGQFNPQVSYYRHKVSCWKFNLITSCALTAFPVRLTNRCCLRLTWCLHWCVNPMQTHFLEGYSVHPWVHPWVHPCPLIWVGVWCPIPEPSILHVDLLVPH